jgi:hypothetical protein
MIDVVDHQHPLPAAENPGDAVQLKRSYFSEHPQGKIIRSVSVGQQPGPHQPARLPANRRRAQHLEPLPGTLTCGDSRKFSAARARRPGDRKHAASTAGGAVEQAPNLGHFTTSAG